MSFTTPCFVKITEDNKESLKDNLINLGYKHDRDYKSCEGYPAEYLVAYSGDIIKYCTDYRRLWKGMFNVTRLDIVESLRNYIGCGTNTDLFLAIAAMRDDSDYMQWFIEDITKPYGVGGQICGLEPRRKIGERWICQKEKESGESMRMSNSIKEDIENSYNGNSDYRKATVSELITYFKNKEQ